MFTNTLYSSQLPVRPPTHQIFVSVVAACVQTARAVRRQLLYICITSLTLLNIFYRIKSLIMFNCVICEKVYVHKRDLNRHAKAHDGSTNSCGICFKTFTQRAKLSIHVQNRHSKYAFCKYLLYKYKN